MFILQISIIEVLVIIKKKYDIEGDKYYVIKQVLPIKVYINN